jgi:hypothetical protein
MNKAPGKFNARGFSYLIVRTFFEVFCSCHQAFYEFRIVVKSKQASKREAVLRSFSPIPWLVDPYPLTE